MRHRMIRKELPPGYTLGWPEVYRGENEEPHKIGGRGGHLYVLRPDGTPLRMANGLPVKIACSPQGNRSERNDLAKIRRALREQGVTT